MIAPGEGESLWAAGAAFAPDAAAPTIAAAAAAFAASRALFTDPAFPPEASSLARTFISTSDPDMWEAIVWRRPADVWPGGRNVALFGKTVAATDVVSRSLRDDAFVSALRVLAIDPARVRRCIRDDGARDAGCIAVRLYRAGLVRGRGACCGGCVARRMRGARSCVFLRLCARLMLRCPAPSLRRHTRHRRATW